MPVRYLMNKGSNGYSKVDTTIKFFRSVTEKVSLGERLCGSDVSVLD
jgi:hypothetical protein